MSTSYKKKILEVLEKYGELNATRIARLAGLNYRVAIKYLKELLEEGIVEERRYGRLRLFKLKPRKSS
ncbi:MAG: winged helix-turn-helix domain-containing protein [Thermoprotei archaeon]